MTVVKAVHPHPVPIKPKRTLPKVQAHIEKETQNPESPPANSDPSYTMDDWQKEVAENVTPGQPIPDWLSAKAPQ